MKATKMLFGIAASINVKIVLSLNMLQLESCTARKEMPRAMVQNFIYGGRSRHGVSTVLAIF